MADEGELPEIIELDESLGEVEAPPVLKPGSYTGEVQEVQMATSQAGNRYFSIRLVINKDQLAPDQQDDFDEDPILYWNRQTVPTDRRSKFNLRKLYEALGLDPNVTTVDASEWIGCRTKITVVSEKYQGEERAQIRALSPTDETPAATAKRARARRR